MANSAVTLRRRLNEMTFARRTLVAVLAFLVCSTFVLGQVPSSKHVYIVAEENHSYQHLLGSANMPYLNGLINQNGLATQFYANQHSSLPDYFWVTAGQPITEDNETTLTFDVDNIVRRVMQQGLSYKAYAQSCHIRDMPASTATPTAIT